MIVDIFRVEDGKVVEHWDVIQEIPVALFPPLNDNAIARPRILAGSDSTAVLRPPGNVTPSPRPKSARAAAKPMNPYIQPCEMLATVQMPTPMSMPTRSPM